MSQVQNKKMFYIFSDEIDFTNIDTQKHYKKTIDKNIRNMYKYIFEIIIKKKKIKNKAILYGIDINSENDDFYLFHYICDFNKTVDIYDDHEQDIDDLELNYIDAFKLFYEIEKNNKKCMKKIMEFPLYEKTLTDSKNYEVIILKCQNPNVYHSVVANFKIFITEKIDSKLVNKHIDFWNPNVDLNVISLKK